MNSSIRKRLLWALLLTLIVLATGASCVTYTRARSDVDKLFDYEMKQMVYTLATHIASHPELADEPLLRLEHDFVTQVWNKDGKLLFSSRPDSGPKNVLSIGFSDYGGPSGWRTFTTTAGNYILQAAQKQSLRGKLAADIALNAMLPILAIVPLGGIAIWLLLGYGLSPLRHIAREVELRDPALLTPLTFVNQPAEIAPLVKSLNDLLARLDRALRVEREFIADASHELRSPITALQLQIELLETTQDDAQRKELTADIRSGIERFSRLIEQILLLARLDPDYGGTFETIDLQDSITEIIESLQPLAAAKNIGLTKTISTTASITGDTGSMRALLRNLVDNAIRYTPAYGAVHVELTTSADHYQIKVLDTGPGMPEETLGKAFARFYRGANDGGGTGLGLAIARRAADRLGARLSLANRHPGTGLEATINFDIPSIPVNKDGKSAVKPSRRLFEEQKSTGLQSD